MATASSRVLASGFSYAVAAAATVPVRSFTRSPFHDQVQDLRFVDMPRSALVHDAALLHHADAVGETEHFGYLAGDQQDTDVRVGQSAHQRVQLGAGTDVHTAGRFVQQQ
jgi:hypothetical protein